LPVILGIMVAGVVIITSIMADSVGDMVVVGVGDIEVGSVVPDTIHLHSQARLVVLDLGVLAAVPVLPFMVAPFMVTPATVTAQGSDTTSLVSRSTLAMAGGK
jgi:hypothetical protein